MALALGKRPDSEFQTEMRGDLLGGVLVLQHTGVTYDRSASANALYPQNIPARPRPKKFRWSVYSVLRVGKSAGRFHASLDAGRQILTSPNRAMES